MKIYVAAFASAALAVLFVWAFFRAVPVATDQARAGRQSALHAACDGALQPSPDNPVLGKIGDGDAPDFTLHDWAGHPVKLSDLRGRVVLLNFWATWCKTCDVEMPSLERLAAAEQGKDFTLLAVSVDDDWNAVRRYFPEGTRMSVVLDTKRAVPAQYGTEKFPETFLIDRDGKIRYYVISDRNWSSPDIQACIDHLVDG